VAREETLEVPEGVAPPTIEQRFLGRVVSVTPAGDGRYAAIIDYPVEALREGPAQLLNVLYGNISLLGGVRLIDVALPADRPVVAGLSGPRHGIGGIRAAAQAREGRALVCVAIKPMGLTADELARLAERLVRSGVDLVKDDHGLTDQGPAPFALRLGRVSEAVARANAHAGTSGVYVPNITAGPAETLARAREAVRAGCRGVLVAPSLAGVGVLGELARMEPAPFVMAHPTHAPCAPEGREGIAPEVLLGTLWRAAGADAVIFPNAGGRFDWPWACCREIHRRLRRPTEGIHPAFPVPGGGIDAGRVAFWAARYGPDTIFLVGGSLLAHTDLDAAARAVVAAVRLAHTGTA